MSQRYETWKAAHTAALAKARAHKLDVAIRDVREFGKIGYNVSFASRNDSDSARAEIVTPADAALAS